MVMVGKLHMIGGLSLSYLSFSSHYTFSFTLFSSVCSGFFPFSVTDVWMMYFCWFHYYLCVIGWFFFRCLLDSCTFLCML